MKLQTKAKTERLTPSPKLHGEP